MPPKIIAEASADAVRADWRVSRANIENGVATVAAWMASSFSRLAENQFPSMNVPTR
jgi:hypothetical protein